MLKNKQSLLLIVLTTAFAMLLSACVIQPPAGASDAPAVEAETVTVTHPQGETTVVKNPETVIVLNYSALDTLDQMGIPVAGLPQGPLVPAHLDKYNSEEYTNIGSMREIDYEVVNSLDPDLIIVGLRTAPLYEEMSKIAPTIDVTVDWANKQETFNAYVTNLGIIFDMEEEAAEQLAAVNARIDEVRATAEADGRSALVIMTSGGELKGYGPGSRFGMIHDMLGVAPSTETMATEIHGDTVSFEFVLEENPDILYILDRDAAVGSEGDTASSMLDNELIAATTAGAEGNIVYLDPGPWYMADAGLSTFMMMIDEVAEGLE
ncbi:MAG: ABC transporter substrate-binding protein [Chloroflexota bacterium]